MPSNRTDWQPGDLATRDGRSGPHLAVFQGTSASPRIGFFVLFNHHDRPTGPIANWAMFYSEMTKIGATP